MIAAIAATCIHRARHMDPEANCTRDGAQWDDSGVRSVDLRAVGSIGRRGPEGRFLKG